MKRLWGSSTDGGLGQRETSTRRTRALLYRSARRRLLTRSALPPSGERPPFLRALTRETCACHAFFWPLPGALAPIPTAWSPTAYKYNVQLLYGPKMQSLKRTFTAAQRPMWSFSVHMNVTVTSLGALLRRPQKSFSRIIVERCTCTLG